jgi:hypothetical protein
LRWAIRTFGGTVAQLDPEWQPPAVDDHVIAVARAHSAALEQYLTPIEDQTWLSARIDALRQHGYLEATSPLALQLVLSDWTEALMLFPQWAIAAASKDVLAAGRIGIAEMVHACREALGTAPLELEALQRLVDPAEQRAARQRVEDARAALSERERQRAVVRDKLATDPDWSPVTDAWRRLGSVLKGEP